MFNLVMAVSSLCDGAISASLLVLLPETLADTKEKWWMSVWMTLPPIFVFLFSPVCFILLESKARATLSLGVACFLQFPAALILSYYTETLFVTIGVCIWGLSTSILWPTIYYSISIQPSSHVKLISIIEIATGLGRIMGTLFLSKQDIRLYPWAIFGLLAAISSLCIHFDSHPKVKSNNQMDETFPLLEKRQQQQQQKEEEQEQEKWKNKQLVSFKMSILLLFLVHLSCGAIDCTLTEWISHLKLNVHTTMSLYSLSYMVFSIFPNYFSWLFDSMYWLLCIGIICVGFTILSFADSLVWIVVGLVSVAMGQAILFVISFALLLSFPKNDCCMNAAQVFQLVPELSSLLSPWVYYIGSYFLAYPHVFLAHSLGLGVVVTIILMYPCVSQLFYQQDANIVL